MIPRDHGLLGEKTPGLVKPFRCFCDYEYSQAKEEIGRRLCWSAEGRQKGQRQPKKLPLPLVLRLSRILRQGNLTPAGVYARTVCLHRRLRLCHFPDDGPAAGHLLQPFLQPGQGVQVRVLRDGEGGAAEGGTVDVGTGVLHPADAVRLPADDERVAQAVLAGALVDIGRLIGAQVRDIPVLAVDGQIQPPTGAQLHRADRLLHAVFSVVHAVPVDALGDGRAGHHPEHPLQHAPAGGEGRYRQHRDGAHRDHSRYRAAIFSVVVHRNLPFFLRAAGRGRCSPSPAPARPAPSPAGAAGSCRPGASGTLSAPRPPRPAGILCSSGPGGRPCRDIGRTEPVRLPCGRLLSCFCEASYVRRCRGGNQHTWGKNFSAGLTPPLFSTILSAACISVR